MAFPVDPDTFRLHVSTTLGDEALQTLLDAAYEAIILYAGPYAVVSGADDQVNEIITPRGIGPLLRLSRAAQSIEEVIVGTTLLSADDYSIGSTGNILRRLNDGTTPHRYWNDRVYVTYTPASDLALREMVQIGLAKLDIAFNPTLVSQTIGSWSESYQQGKSYPEQRADILALLSPIPAGIW